MCRQRSAQAKSRSKTPETAWLSHDTPGVRSATVGVRHARCVPDPVLAVPRPRGLGDEFFGFDRSLGMDYTPYSPAWPLRTFRPRRPGTSAFPGGLRSRAELEQVAWQVSESGRIYRRPATARAPARRWSRCCRRPRRPHRRVRRARARAVADRYAAEPRPQGDDHHPRATRSRLGQPLPEQLAARCGGRGRGPACGGALRACAWRRRVRRVPRR